MSAQDHHCMSFITSDPYESAFSESNSNQTSFLKVPLSREYRQMIRNESDKRKVEELVY